MSDDPFLYSNEFLNKKVQKCFLHFALFFVKNLFKPKTGHHSSPHHLKYINNQGLNKR